MATDVEESDTDDHERPAPPKRQCTRLTKINETCWETENQSDEKEETTQEPENVEYDDAEKHAREKLKRWQACQIVKGFVDNTINKVLENYFVNAPSYYPLDVSRFHLFRENDMEESAIMMAIRNHGLVHSAGLVSQSRAFYSDKAPGYWTNNDYSDRHCACPSKQEQKGIEDFPSSLATTSANSLRLNNSDVDQYSTLNCDGDKIDASEQENFLERAVAEAIKKKGLSALSVDYG